MPDNDTPPDTTTSGIAVLAEDSPTWDDGPFPVRGVALPEEVVTHGANTQNTAVYWPSNTVADAVALFDGAKITDPSEHDPETALENPQPSPETIIGEITAARYKPGIGVLYEGEVDDPEIAKRIDRGRVEVSPTLFRRLGGTHDDSGAREATEIVGVRDLSVVARGAATGNSIEPASAALSALSASALSAAFDDTTDSSQSDDGEDVTTRQSTGAASTSTDKSVTTMDDIENDNTNDDPLAEPLRDILAIVDDPAEAVDVLKQYEFADEPVVVEKSDVETLQKENEEARDAFAGVLAEQEGPFSADSLADSKMSTLTEPFRDEDGEIDLDVLAQQPETSSLGGGTDEGDDPVGLDALSADDRDEARELYRRQKMLDSRTPEHAESLRGDLVEMMGVDSFDDIDVEAF